MEFLFTLVIVVSMQGYDQVFYVENGITQEECHNRGPKWAESVQTLYGSDSADDVAWLCALGNHKLGSRHNESE